MKERKAGDTKKAVAEPSIDPESLATFKINFDENELDARNALKLPYERWESPLHFSLRHWSLIGFFNLFAEQVRHRSQ